MSDLLQGVVNNLPTSPTAVNTPAPLQLTPLLATKVGLVEPRYLELAREGRLFSFTLTVAAAVAPLQIVPTTTAAFVINHIVSGSAKVVVPLRIGAILASGTADTGATLYGMCTNGALATQLTANNAGIVQGCLRGDNVSSVAVAEVSKAVAGGWMALGSMQNGAGTTPGTGIVVDTEGIFVIRPTYALGLHVVSGAGTTAKFMYSVIYAELPSLTP